MAAGFEHIRHRSALSDAACGSALAASVRSIAVRDLPAHPDAGRLDLDADVDRISVNKQAPAWVADRWTCWIFT